jgi:hypothetical protein
MMLITYILALLVLDWLAVGCLLGGCVVSVLTVFRKTKIAAFLAGSGLLYFYGGFLLWVRHQFP